MIFRGVNGFKLERQCLKLPFFKKMIPENFKIIFIPASLPFQYNYTYFYRTNKK